MGSFAKILALRKKFAAHSSLLKHASATMCRLIDDEMEHQRAHLRVPAPYHAAPPA